MRLIVDTHILIWMILSPHLLPPAAKAIIEDESNDVIVSVVSLWEVAIKRRLGRASAPAASTQTFLEECAAINVAILPVAAQHALSVETLPLLHGDPFDRLIVAQAISEQVHLLTHDRHLAGYSDLVMYI
ncbi:type II toxin-antitoxin system VapC family toxin [Kaistia dalseonensis]|uniref:PIN domain nuclease of toxin-antitoxin system n=1 Tax=Kaistia dalseonensis TaxID=410840 RepID=A0ABU0H394_9HYPH|nr:type II toxin-antitoxin system VapC family toxin [Kaistia dalseonensis]MCX5494177.1 type II toxin-antitoxin system VapC family toxin [Kaistia dalseonensis]MDQ0436756.1 PIN domain nuclease of toxin-antitoxin system [Kaistia dalseonensis]